MQVSPAFTAYDVNLPFWSDNAHKSRWFHLPTNTFAGFRFLAGPLPEGTFLDAYMRMNWADH
jgi:hypothetical protein